MPHLLKIYTTILVCDGRKIRQLKWIPCDMAGGKIQIYGSITTTYGLSIQDTSNQPHLCTRGGIRYKK